MAWPSSEAWVETQLGLAGQGPTYLEGTLLAFKTRARANNPDKSTLLASFSDEELKTIARYLGGIHDQ